jgi:oligoribonuclease (3'-5' exoribonuclease)
MAYYKPRYVGCDLECTCLDPHAPEAAILEIAVKVIDARTLETIAEATDVLYWAGNRASLHPAVQRMHTGNGLFDECARQANNVTVEAVSRAYAQFISMHTDGNAPLLGNSVGSYDRRWLEVFMPEVIKSVSHQVVDVSSIGIEMASVGAEVPWIDAPHRSMPDVNRSIETLRWFRKRIGAVSL